MKLWFCGDMAYSTGYSHGNFSRGYSLLVIPCHSAAFVAVLVYGYRIGSGYKELKNARAKSLLFSAFWVSWSN